MTKLPIDSIIPNPNQPRTIFDQSKLEDLAASIKEHGLQQPITVRPRENGMFEIVMGERRWRASKLAGLGSIDVNIRQMDDNEMAEIAIVENLQRADITPLEEARAFQRMIDKGYTPAELAKRLGLKQEWRVQERLALLKLRAEYQDLLAKKQLTPSQAYEMARLSTANQGKLFALIRAGKCPSYNALRAAADGIVEAEHQGEMFSLPKPTREELAAVSALERKIERVMEMVAAGYRENEVVICKKVAPDKAALMADRLTAIQKHLSQLERALRQSAAQAEMAA